MKIKLFAKKVNEAEITVEVELTPEEMLASIKGQNEVLTIFKEQIGDLITKAGTAIEKQSSINESRLQLEIKKFESQSARAARRIKGE